MSPVHHNEPPDGPPLPQEPARVLVTLHFPIDMACAAAVMRAVAHAYPHAVIGENGTIWDRSPGERPPEFLAASDVGKG